MTALANRIRKAALGPAPRRDDVVMWWTWAAQLNAWLGIADAAHVTGILGVGLEWCDFLRCTGTECRMALLFVAEAVEDACP